MRAWIFRTSRLVMKGDVRFLPVLTYARLLNTMQVLEVLDYAGFISVPHLLLFTGLIELHRGLNRKP